MNPEKNPYIREQLNPYKERKEKNPYIKEKLKIECYQNNKNQVDNEDQSKWDGNLFRPKHEENPYLKKNVLVEKEKNNVDRDKNRADHGQKTKAPIIDIKVSMNFVTKIL